MSLLFDHALSNFEPGPEPENHYSISEGDLEDTGETIPVRPIVEFASKQNLSFPDPEKNYTCLPLHTAERAEPTGEYLAYTDSSIHGEIIIYRDADDESRESISVEEFASTRLARRLRFWHSDYQPEEYPDGYDRPIDAKEQPRATIGPDTFIGGLKEHIHNERQARRDRNWEKARTHSPREMFNTGGDAIPELRCHGGTEFEVVPLSRDQPSDDWSYYVPNRFGIHQENEVLLHGPADVFPVPARVSDIRGLTIELDLFWSRIDNSAAVRSTFPSEKEGYAITQLLNPVPTDRELAGVSDLEETDMLDALAGQRPITFTNSSAGDVEPKDSELNQEQGLAADLALLADDFLCIHGPPGTGKTRTLIEIIRRMVAAGERVLVCADSNQAVDNLLIGDSTAGDPDESSLHAHAQCHSEELSVKRTKAYRRNNDLLEPYADPPGRADVVVTTNNSAADLSPSFDSVIIDEATQATVASCCIPLSKANRAILAGDHKQLPPFSSRDGPPESEMGMSLFEHLYADSGVFEGVGVKLTTQYRMHQDIAAFSNAQFYDGDLRNGQAIEPLSSRPETIEAFNVGGDVVLHDTSRSNKTEAKLVGYLIQQLLDELAPTDIGVITPYSAQVRVIEQMIDRYLPDAEEVTVNTIDSMQGSEREAIILSLVRSNPDGHLGFLGRQPDGPRRLNVALTRAKRYCAVIGDLHTIRYESDHKAVDLYQDFYSYFSDTGRQRDVQPEYIEL